MEQPSGQAPSAHRGWDPVATGLIAGALVAALWSIAASSGWIPLEPLRIRAGYIALGIAALALTLIAEAAARAWLVGSRGRTWAWAGAGAAVIVASVLLAVARGDELSASVWMPVPRLVWAGGALLLLAIGLGRRGQTDTDIDDRLDWFARTQRVLERRRLWSPDRAEAQVRHARDEFNHAQARRTQGSEPLTPLEYFGQPEAYALSLPDAAPRPARWTVAGRWSYLITAIALGGWAAYRVRLGMSWLTVVLLVFAVVALALFIVTSIMATRRR